MGGLDPKYILSGVILQSREVYTAYTAHMDTGYKAEIPIVVFMW